ncbi:acyltransferase family protein [Aetokthonos hydrillicola Thurmond2011]|jgi:1-acyl-sn-glycerol-3-phosphate acyltransferase|uniref:Acyltransferase family protein n=1 Tax=Aetokthonos hydrillicola Thurmond2011 TaxID=2712845 RepID=A0AAP5I9B2_9CYAN|nr:lysophospholipid acyltransferase family protein [Aetokthonos hydrillicola]MBO3461668.1 acyltransferase family protein [Aetokthonos hydrillicola CCALA 1050]MBW4588719.1 acyltransferase family protein [Aetokthonos hydrillicola CCALA 1050]MDR9895947.1 acyltransferase family protein [Aetokthonos hydrillicola Thurmond2011]
MSHQKKPTSLPGWSLEERDPEFIESLMPIWELLYRHYFRVKTDGWHHIPTVGKVLLVGSHNGGMASPDLVMMTYDWFRHFGTSRLVYGLMHPYAWKVSPPLAKLAEKVGAIIAHPKMASAAFAKDASVLVYPGGQYDMFRPHSQRYKIHLANRKGFIKLALKEEVPIIPVISVGAHDTLIVLGDFYEVMKQLHQWGLPWLYQIDPEVFPIYLGLPWGLGIGPLPNIPFPTQIHTRVCAPIVFERYGNQAARDREYVNACYDLVSNQMQQELDCLVKDNEKGIVRNDDAWLLDPR